MQKYQSIISGTNGSVIRNVPVTVLKEDGSLAEIFMDREGQVQAPNPLVTDSRGVFYFYAKNGRYSLRTAADGVQITDADTVLLFDPDETASDGPIADAVRRAEDAAERAETALGDSGLQNMVQDAQDAAANAVQAVIDANQAVASIDAALIEAGEAKDAAQAAAQTASNAASGAQAVKDSLLTYSGTLSATPEWSDVPAHVDLNLDTQAQALANRTQFIILKLKGRLLTPYDFGGVGDGVHDDTDAIVQWLASAEDRAALGLPPGFWTFEDALLSTVNNLLIVGRGTRQTVMKYMGTSTTVDTLTIGDGVNSVTGLDMRDISFESGTQMTSGCAVRIKKMQNGSKISNVDFGGRVGAANLWNGLHMDNVNVCTYSGGIVRTQNKGVMMNGEAGSDAGSDVTLDNLHVLFCKTGTHVGGGIGGVYHRNVLYFGNNTSALVDTTLANRKNREIVFNDDCILDGSYENGLVVDDALTGGGSITFNAYIASSGAMGSDGAGNNVWVKNWRGSRISFGSGQNFNARADGVRVDDATTEIAFSSGLQITNNGGYGVNATVVMNREIVGEPQMYSNTEGNWSPNSHRGSVALSLASGWTGTTVVSKKKKRCQITGKQSQTAGAIAQYSVIATVPEGYFRVDVDVPLLLVYSGGSSGDGMIPGRVNPDGTIQTLQAIGNAANIVFSGSWDLD